MEILNISSLFSIVFTVIYFLIFFALIRGWLKLPVGSSKGSETIAVTIVIVARNEEDNIRRTLDAILLQHYPNSLVEIIVVDDHSTDNTVEIVSSYSEKRVKLLSLEVESAINSYKKAAITMAIAHASGSLIITTDADCTMRPNWISAMVATYEREECKILSGPVVYYEEKNFFQRLQTLEFLFLIGLGASSIGNKNPNTCNGANLLYEKDAFLAVGGFEGIDDLASGDDELLLHKMVDHYPHAVAFAKNRDAMVFTYAKATMSEFISQRKRWASKSMRYSKRSVILIGAMIWLFNVSILLNVILGFFNVDFLAIAGWQLIVKISMEYLFLNILANFFERRDVLKHTPLLTLIHNIYIIFIGIAGNFGKYQWKGRLVK